MRICVIGAGAIGGFLGTRLAANSQNTVSVIARGATYAALKTHGWRLRSDKKIIQAPAVVSENPDELGPQDLIILAVKGFSLPQAARLVPPLLQPDTIVLPAMNGVPWWFLLSEPGFEESFLNSVDPQGSVSHAISLKHVVGCVIHASISAPEPGLAEQMMGNGLTIGEPSGRNSTRVQQLQSVLDQAGFDTTLSSNIRRDIWYKLWGNMTINPIAALTGATADRILDDPLVAEFCSAVMLEAAAIGSKIGCAIDQTPEDRHKVTRKLGPFKPSMLQDAEHNKPMELDSLVAAVREIGAIVGVQTPHTDIILGLARLFARTRGLYPNQ